jgi:excisionase family DNA binding protein
MTTRTLAPTLTVAEIAETNHVHPITVRNWITSGELEAVKLGRHRGAPLRVPLKAWLRFVDARTAAVTTPTEVRE